MQQYPVEPDAHRYDSGLGPLVPSVMVEEDSTSGSGDSAVNRKERISYLRDRAARNSRRSWFSDWETAPPWRDRVFLPGGGSGLRVAVLPAANGVPTTGATVSWKLISGGVADGAQLGVRPRTTVEESCIGHNPDHWHSIRMANGAGSACASGGARRCLARPAR